MLGLFLREVPEALRAGVARDALRVYGSVIRDPATGRIAGFLQETSGMGKLRGALTGPGGTMADVAGFAVTAYQNEQIKAAVATVQSLQVADLALGAAGIGVSVAGFALLAHRIGRVERKVEAASERLERLARGMDALRLEPIRQDLTRLRTTARQLEQGWSLPDPAREWEAVAREAGYLVDAFERRADEALTAGPADIETVDPFLQALALAAATQVSARMAAGQDVVARLAASDGAAALARHGERIRPAEAALARMDPAAVPGDRAWAAALDAAAEALRPTVHAIRVRELAADGVVETLAELDRQGVNGRAWLEAAREETHEPLLCLLPAR